MFAEPILHPWGEYHFFMIFHFHLFLNMICSNFIGMFLSTFRDILKGGTVSLSLHMGLRPVRVELVLKAGLLHLLPNKCVHLPAAQEPCHHRLALCWSPAFSPYFSWVCEFFYIVFLSGIKSVSFLLILFCFSGEGSPYSVILCTSSWCSCFALRHLMVTFGKLLVLILSPYITAIVKM